MSVLGRSANNAPCGSSGSLYTHTQSFNSGLLACKHTRLSIISTIANYGGETLVCVRYIIQYV